MQSSPAKLDATNNAHLSTPKILLMMSVPLQAAPKALVYWWHYMLHAGQAYWQQTEQAALGDANSATQQTAIHNGPSQSQLSERG
jgi:hypothetical protein